MLQRTSFIAIACLALSGCQAAQTPPATPVAAAPALSPDEAFLAANAKAPGVVAFPGIQYKVLQSGPATGAHPKRSNVVRINYEGRLIDGTVFDSSYARNEPAEFPLGRLITGWQTIVPLMRVGDVWEVYIPAVMAYGAAGAGAGKIPANATLIFKIELLGFRAEEPTPAQPPAKKKR